MNSGGRVDRFFGVAKGLSFGGGERERISSGRERVRVDVMGAGMGLKSTGVTGEAGGAGEAGDPGEDGGVGEEERRRERGRREPEEGPERGEEEGDRGGEIEGEEV